MKPGESVSYELLSQEIGKDVQRVCWGHLTTAREWLEKDDRIVTECDPGKGVRRLTNDDHPVVMQLHRKRALSQVRRGLEKASCTDYEALPREGRRNYNRELAHLGLLHAASSEKASKAIEAVASARISSLSCHRLAQPS